MSTQKPTPWSAGRDGLAWLRARDAHYAGPPGREPLMVNDWIAQKLRRKTAR